MGPLSPVGLLKTVGLKCEEVDQDGAIDFPIFSERLENISKLFLHSNSYE